ncbi:hypothetical protein P5673_027586 [Acropora cervicornis]|uniref:Uncharacterized protein n=1 Tax=Acropora cervicornis TaxID=6130 RepID=A0AAD9PYP5_ACRCE|nr:hypothetical protein P5673_027586 [Acropora cervicornis]
MNLEFAFGQLSMLEKERVKMNTKVPLQNDKREWQHVRSAKERMRKFNSSSPAIEGEPSTGHQDTTLDLNLSCIGPGTSTSENTTVDLDVSCIEPGTSVNTSSCENTTVELNVQHKSVQTLMDSMQSKLLRETEVLQGKLATTPYSTGKSLMTSSLSPGSY